MTTRLEQRWSDLVTEMGWPASAESIGADLIERYGEPHRRYHGLGHLAGVLAALDLLAGDRPARPTTRLAAWFHDAIYDPLRDDNEALSAELARTSLPATGLDPDSIELVAALVMATTTHAPSGLPEADLLLDADLSSLGAAPDAYDAYSSGVRQEYVHVPDDLYAVGRPMVLRGFTDREHIYLTPAGRERFEQQARANLARELASLE